MFQNSEDEWRKSCFNKQGGHYNIYAMKRDTDRVEFLRQVFPEGEANEMNFVLFSTSGVHGTYVTLEEIEHSLTKYGEGPQPWDDDEEDLGPDDHCCPEVTFLLVQPRIVGMTYGNVRVTLADLPFLKKLRETSWAAVQKVGRSEPPP